MHEPTTVQALLQGGPAGGAVRPVECRPDGRPPVLLLGGGGQAFVGSSDEPAEAGYPMYALEPEPEPIESMWPYRYAGTLSRLTPRPALQHR